MRYSPFKPKKKAYIANEGLNIEIIPPCKIERNGFFGTNLITGDTMQVNITGHHIDLTEAIKSHTQDKLQKLDRHFPDVDQISVILSLEKKLQKAEAKLRFKGQEFFAEALSEDLYHSVDNLVDKLDKQLLKHRDKLKQNRAV